MLQGRNQLVKYLLLFAPDVVALSFVWCVVAGVVSMVTYIYGVCVSMVTRVYGVCCRRCFRW